MSKKTRGRSRTDARAESRLCCAFCGSEPVVERTGREQWLLMVGPGGLFGKPGELTACGPCADAFDRGDTRAVTLRSLVALRDGWPKGTERPDWRQMRAILAQFVEIYSELREPRACSPFEE